MLIPNIFFDIKGDERGKLIALESGGNIDFDIKRVFYIFDSTPDVVRGKHAHHRQKQVLIAVSGSCIITLDDGHARTEVSLNKKNQGLYIAPLIWREMKGFSSDCVLLVLTDQAYEEASYIKDYDDFLRIIHDQNSK